MSSVPTRTRILHAAIDLMGREGPDRFTASALAKEAGVSKATLFHHFDTLDEIPLAALEEVLFDSMSGMDDADSSLADCLDGFAGQLRAFLDNDRFLQTYFAFFVKGIFDERFRKRLARGGFELHDRVTSIVAPHVGPDEDPEVVARMVEVMLDGLALHHLMMGDEAVLSRAWDRFAELLLAAQTSTS